MTGLAPERAGARPTQSGNADEGGDEHGTFDRQWTPVEGQQGNGAASGMGEKVKGLWHPADPCLGNQGVEIQQIVLKILDMSLPAVAQLTL